MTQAEALSILKMGHNVFLTGGAGSGKTYTLNSYINYLEEHDVSVAVTASTGIAATHMHGITIHAWSGIGIRDHLSDYDIDQMEGRKYLWDRYEKTRVLIIDEVSMLSGNFFDMLDRVCRAFKREPEKAFGGMQIILSGDLFQLPPISKGGEEVNPVTESLAWKLANPVVCYLSEQHRQDDDTFTGILNAIRKDTLDVDHYALLESRVCEYDEENFKHITKLFTHNADVDSINEREMTALIGEERVFEMTSRGKSNVLESLKKSCLAPGTLRLKKGAEVMFVKNNFEKGYVNGTRGRIVEFEDAMPVVETIDGNRIRLDTETWLVEEDGREIAAISQVPLRHAWAITVHKSQGMSLDAAVIDLSKSFTYGMGYVALSRVRRLDGVHLVGFSQSALAIDPAVRMIDTMLKKKSEAATSRLGELSQGAIEQAWREFIVRSGGKLEATKDKKKKEALRTPRNQTMEITYEMLQEGKSIDEIAQKRGLTLGTIIGHLEKAKEKGMKIDPKQVALPKKDLKAIKDAFKKTGEDKLTPVKIYLEKQGHSYDFDTIKRARLLL